MKAIWSLENLVIFPNQDDIDPTLLVVTKYYVGFLTSILLHIFAKDTLKRCLQKDPYNRPAAVELLHHPYLKPPNFPNNDGGNIYLL